MSHLKIVVTAPLNYADKIRQALGEAGAGHQGEYSLCSFSVRGQGRFLPSNQARPHIGQASKLETVDEERIEVVCDRAIARLVVAKLRAAHSYDEPVIDIYQLVEEDEL